MIGIYGLNSQVTLKCRLFEHESVQNRSNNYSANLRAVFRISYTAYCVWFVIDFKFAAGSHLFLRLGN